MTYAVLSVVGIITIIAFCWLTCLRPREPHWILDFVSVGLMVGFMGAAILTYFVTPSLDVTVPIIWYYSPHAYNLVIWPALALLLLRPRFGSQFLGAFVFVYGLSEILWNSIAYLRFDGSVGSPVLSFMTSQYWHVFFTMIVVGTLISYYVLRPRVTPNLTWIFFGCYVFVYGVIAGLPTFGDSPYPTPLYVYAWELAWQVAVWVLISGTFWKRGESPKRRVARFGGVRLPMPTSSKSEPSTSVMETPL